MLNPIREDLRGVMADIVSEELNLKNITWVDDVESLVSLGAKANFKVLGRRLGKMMKPVANAISALPSATVMELMNGGSVVIEGETITENDIVVVQNAKTEGAIASTSQVTVVLNTDISPELHLEGLAREIVSKIQGARKDAGLEVEDRIILSLKTDSTELKAAIEAHQELILSEVLGLRLEDSTAEHSAIDAAGHTLEVALAKATS